MDGLVEAGLLDRLMDRVEAGEVRLTGEGGFLPAMIKAVLERGLQAELADHLGYGKGDPAGRGSPNSRNGTTPKTVSSEVGDIDLATPRDRAGSFEPRLVPKGARRVGGLDEQIISLYAGGMTIRDIQAHLARTIGTELSHDTISKITDAVLDEVKAWQTRPLEELYPNRVRCRGGEGRSGCEGEVGFVHGRYHGLRGTRGCGDYCGCETGDRGREENRWSGLHIY